MEITDKKLKNLLDRLQLIRIKADELLCELQTLSSIVEEPSAYYDPDDYLIKSDLLRSQFTRAKSDDS